MTGAADALHLLTALDCALSSSGQPSAKVVQRENGVEWLPDMDSNHD